MIKSLNHIYYTFSYNLIYKCNFLFQIIKSFSKLFQNFSPFSLNDISITNGQHFYRINSIVIAVSKPSPYFFYYWKYNSKILVYIEGNNVNCNLNRKASVVFIYVRSYINRKCSLTIVFSDYWSLTEESISPVKQSQQCQSSQSMNRHNISMKCKRGDGILSEKNTYII